MYLYSKVCHIACGEDFTAFLTLDGGVFTCGAGEYGQTGHGNTKDELVPRKVCFPYIISYYSFKIFIIFYELNIL